MLITLMFGFHISYVKKTFLTVFCMQFSKHKENVPLIKQIVMGDGKSMLYNNVKWKRSRGKSNKPLPTTPKADLHPKTVMLCIWWDCKAVLYYELFLEN